MATTKIVLLSDSTGGWFVDSAAPASFFPETLYNRYGRTMKVSENTSFGGSYSTQTTRWYGGVGADEIHLYDGSVGGSNWDDVTDLAARVTAVAPDLVLIAYGVNGGVTGASGLDALIDDVQAAVPSATVVLLSQNPVVSHSGDDQNRNLVQGYATSYGLTFIDVYQAFIDTGDYASYLGDGTHPNDAGKDLYAATVDGGLLDAALLGADQASSTVAVLDSAVLVLRASRYGGSGDWLDESGNGHDAVPTGSPTWDGKKFTLSGSGQFFTVTDADDLDPGAGDFTVVVVATPAAATGADLISKRVGGAVPWWDIETNNSTGFVVAGVSDGSAIVTASRSSSITVGARSVFSSRIIRASDLIRLTVDQASTNNTIAAVGAVNSTTDLVIGGTLNPDWSGDIWGVAIFSTSLSDAEVAAVGVELLSVDVADWKIGAPASGWKVGSVTI